MKKIFAVAICCTVINVTNAADTDQTEGSSAPTNSAQTQRAENLSLAVADNLANATENAKHNVEISQLLADEALQAKNDAQAALDAISSGDTAALLEASKNLVEAQLALSSALSGLGTANQQLDRISSITPEEVSQMRNSGLGWGQIAKQLGLHPKSLGLGHNKRLDKNKNIAPGAATSDDSDQSAATKKRGNSSSKSKSNKSNKSSNGNSGNNGNNGGGNGGSSKGNKK